MPNQDQVSSRSMSLLYQLRHLKPQASADSPFLIVSLDRSRVLIKVSDVVLRFRSKKQMCQTELSSVTSQG